MNPNTLRYLINAAEPQDNFILDYPDWVGEEFEKDKPLIKVRESMIVQRNNYL